MATGPPGWWAGGGGGGAKGDVPDPATRGADAVGTAVATEEEAFLREKLFLWCLRADKWRWYLSPAVNRHVATFLLSAESWTQAAERQAGAAAVAAVAAKANGGGSIKKAPLNVYFDMLSGVRLAVLPKIDRHAKVSKAKERFMVKAKAKAKAVKVATSRWRLGALRLFLDAEELQDSNTLWAQGVRDNAVVTVLFAAADRDNLEALYDATSGPYWGKSKHRIGWKKPCSIAEWVGVSVDPTGEFVSHLRRNRLQMNGELPPQIGSFQNILTLDLSGNRLRGQIPTEVGRLITCQTLSLQYNRLQGPIPSEIGNMVALRSLMLNKNRLTGRVPRTLVELGDTLRAVSVQDNRLQDGVEDRDFLARQLPRCQWYW